MSYSRRLRNVAAVLTIALMVIWGWFLTSKEPVQAQPRPTAAITLDGRQLFEVSEAGQFSADNRAADANMILKQAVRSPETVNVEILESNQLPVIRVNGRHLLTVTSQDTPTGRTKQEQAQIWAQRIAEGIRQGQEERRLSYFWRAILLAILFVLAAFAVHQVLGWIWHYWLRRLVPREASHPDTGAQP
ncbi:MAG: hypothetical protein N2235_03810 [Fischerella sp.]|nr:hypothetical protein [Fischerella sp.]